MDGSGIESWCERGITCCPAQPRSPLSPLTTCTGSFPGGKAGGTLCCSSSLFLSPGCKSVSAIPPPHSFPGQAYHSMTFTFKSGDIFTKIHVFICLLCLFLIFALFLSRSVPADLLNKSKRASTRVV
jgi:hypothetical protein